MHKNLKSFLMAMMMVSTFTVTTFATTKQNEQKIQQLKEQNQESKSKLNENLTLEQQAEKKLNDLEEKVEIMDSKISEKQIRINEADKLIARTNESISKGQLELDKAELDMKREQEVFGERASALYMNGTGSYFQLLLESDGFFDLISRVQTLKDISEHDNNIMKELTAKTETVKTKQKSLNVEKTRLVSLRDENKKDLATILDDKNELNVIVAKATEERNHFASISKNYRDKQAANDRQIAIAQEAIDRITNPKKYEDSRGNSDIPASEFGNRVVQEARKYLGKPYVYGGSNPSTSFDCSGLVQYVFRSLGVNLPRVTYDQINVGRAVSRADLQPGDLVFFGSSTAPHHVGIYIGNNCYLHAPQTGDVIKISVLSRSVAAARRIR